MACGIAASYSTGACHPCQLCIVYLVAAWVTHTAHKGLSSTVILIVRTCENVEPSLRVAVATTLLSSSAAWHAKLAACSHQPRPWLIGICEKRSEQSRHR